jgi:hypothetical protein
VNDPTATALALAGFLVLLGVGTLGWQVRGLRQLNSRPYVPSDERGYLTGRHRRRVLVGVLLTVVGVMIGWAYVSGMENRADALGEARPADAPKPPMTDAEKQFVRWWGGYWIVVLLLVMTIVGLAGADALATRRYWLAQYQELRDEHKAKLERDLALHRQKRNDRFGNRLSGEE